MKNLSKTFLLVASLILLSACTPSDALKTPRATLGNVGSPVTLDLFSDFQCPACAQVSPQVEDFVRANPERARLTFHHFPLSQHENAFRAGVAAECANDQGKFWEYGDLAYQNHTNLTEEKLKEMARSLSLDTTAFAKCLDANQTADRVRADLNDGNERGVSYTPSIYVNGKLVQFTTREAFEGYVKSIK
ncbi:thioredoxin domain-containing protein [Candidatus Peregrinibacteria bacterium]|nr:thioredoxin domain-containing protein [Candidatus Peregrinibacteria bacterium]